MKFKSQKTLENVAWILLITGFVLIIPLIIIFISNQNINISTKVDDNLVDHFASVFGGIIGTLWSLSGILFFYITLQDQKASIQMQKEELELQRHELSLTREEFASQNNTLKKQRFENTFFHLVTLHNEIVDKLSYEEVGEKDAAGRFIKHEKRNYFEKAYLDLPKIGSVDLSVEYESDQDALDNIVDAYNYFWPVHGSLLSNYFRNFYHIIKYIHLTNLINPDEKQFYVNIVRAQLSSYELGLLFYNMLIDTKGFPKMKFLDQQYDILQNMEDDLVFNQSHWEIFNNRNAENPFK